MAKRLIGAQKPFKMLVANLRQGSDPSKGASGNPVKVRSTFEQQRVFDIGGRGVETLGAGGPGTHSHRGVMLSGSATPAGGTITVTANTFSGVTLVNLGGTEISIGDVLGASAIATAGNLADAISAIPGFSASNGGTNVVTVSGPQGPVGNFTTFRAEGVSAHLLTLSPDNGTLSGAGPTIGAAAIT